MISVISPGHFGAVRVHAAIRAYIISATVMYFGPFLPKKKESDKSGHVAVH
jgi:hypothetical protein